MFLQFIAPYAALLACIVVVIGATEHAIDRINRR